jgi:hypothetical protein
MLALASAALLGLLLGLRHAFEPDHLAAVSTLVGERRGAAGFWLGGVWGLGHTLSLVVVGGSLIALRTQLSPALEGGFELAVAAMLVFLGTRSIVRAARWHRGQHADGRAHTPRLARRSLLIGMTHGLAGSGALTALAFAEIPGRLAALAYILVFGLGSAVGMGTMTRMAGAGLARLPDAQRWSRPLAMTVGILSLGMGLFWGVPPASRLLRGGPRPDAVAVQP